MSALLATAFLLIPLATGSLACSAESGAAEDDELVVFAAASLRDVLAEIDTDFRDATGLAPSYNFAGSNVLALQIEASGGAADIFLSANEEWMDRVEDGGLTVTGSRHGLLGNELVIVASAASPWRLDRLEDLADLNFRYLSLADPQAVPAGRYAQRLLSSVHRDGSSLWSRVESRVAPAADVRAALAMVEARPDAVGIVYQTDLQGAPGVRVLARVPEPPAPPIRYSVATIRGASPAAQTYLDFLSKPSAGAIFERHGFSWKPVVG